jgi:uncharacterized membrane protein YphA (DoxX/SURF4 family)
MRKVLTWVLSGLLALAFVAAGAAKLTGQQMMVAEFETFGLPLWFMYLTGLLEVAGAVLVLVPRLAFAGAGLLACIMLGALAAHLSHGQAAMIGAPALLLIMAVAVGTLRGWGRDTGPSLRRAA